jgi:arylsulfatase A-like enzyme
MYRFVFALIALVALGTFANAADRPNFVFMFTDDQRYDAMSVVQKEHGDKGRFPWFKTPNMDRLAAEGIRFRNAFVVNALCSPSRACYLSGKYSHVNGIYNNRTPLSDKLATHASILRGEGYSTGYVGKWHMGSQPARPGFDWFASFTGQSVYFNAPFLVNGKSESTDEWTDDRSAKYAIRFLETDRAKDKPFVLVVGFKAPHGPTTPPKRLENAFANEMARAVPNLGLRPGFNTDIGKSKQKEIGDKVPANLNYFRCVAGVDDNVGIILDALDRLKLSENTVVVYASDNGYYFGEHSLGDKRSAYEESIRIPFLVRLPSHVRDPKGAGIEKAGRKEDAMILNVDLAPTFLDYAGVQIPKTMDGRSIRPLLEGRKTDWRQAFFYCYFFERNFPGTPTVTAVRTDSAVLIKYPGKDQWTEMFDLKSDPYQLKNLFKEAGSADLRRQLEAEYDRQAKAIAFRIPDFADTPKAK